MSSAALRASVAAEAEIRPETDPDAVAEMRQLVSDMRDAAEDGRMLAQRYAELLTRCVEEYCVEFELRAEAVLRRLEQNR